MNAWPTEVHRLLRSAGVRQVAMVPDAGHAALIGLCEADSSMRVIRLTTEEEGIALLCGAWLGGNKGVLLMQSSGVGNCINFLSLIQHCRIPFLTLVTMRGDFGEQNPWQFAMGRAVEPTLAAMGVDVLRADRADDVLPTVDAALGMVDRGGRAVAMLLGQRLLGAKTFGPQGAP